MSRVSGVQTTPAQKSEDILMKTQFLNENYGEKNIIFATGTPVETWYIRSGMPILRCFYYLFLKLPWAAPVNLLKSLGEIAVVVKAAKTADGVYGGRRCSVSCTPHFADGNFSDTQTGTDPLCS